MNKDTLDDRFLSELIVDSASGWPWTTESVSLPCGDIASLAAIDLSTSIFFLKKSIFKINEIGYAVIKNVKVSTKSTAATVLRTIYNQ